MSNQMQNATLNDHARLHVGNSTIVNVSANPDDATEKYIASLRSTDPREDKIRIEDTKGGLLKDSCSWVFQAPEFKTWRDAEHPILWIKGNPGKGKTMLLSSIINELEPYSKLSDPNNAVSLSYFFCQATNSGLNNAAAVLRGLVFLLSIQNPSVVSELIPKYGAEISPDHWNSRVTITETLKRFLQHPAFQNCYLVVDALDECETDLNYLLDFILSSLSLGARWIVSSRFRQEIEERLAPGRQKALLSLEINEASVSNAIEIYIRHQVERLAQIKQCKDTDREFIESYLSRNAQGTFLWIALVCQELRECNRSELVEYVRRFPPGLDKLYDRMVSHIQQSRSCDKCEKVLAVALTVYRPITIKELQSLQDIHGDDDVLDIVKTCGSFLSIKNHTIYFIHQSAKDFLLKTPMLNLFPQGLEVQHYKLFLRCLRAMNILKQDMYGLMHPGTTVSTAERLRPDPDPLIGLVYCATHCVDHLHDADSISREKGFVGYGDELLNSCRVHRFFSEKALFWLEALSLTRNLSAGALALTKVKDMLEKIAQPDRASETYAFIHDSHRFFLYFRPAIEDHPLQIYISGLLLSPKESLIRQKFQSYASKFIKTSHEGLESNWGACLQVLEWTEYIDSISFSPTGEQIFAVGFLDENYIVWNTNDGATHTYAIVKGMPDCVTISSDWRLWARQLGSKVEVLDRDTYTTKASLEIGNMSDTVPDMKFSADGRWLAIATPYELHLYNLETQRLQSYSLPLRRLWLKEFSALSSELAAAACDAAVIAVDLSTGELHSYYFPAKVISLACSPNHQQLTLSLQGDGIWTWDVIQNLCSRKMQFSHANDLRFLTHSPGGEWLAAADESVLVIYNASSNALARRVQMEKSISSIKFSHDGKRLAVALSHQDHPEDEHGGKVLLWDLQALLVEQPNSSENSSLIRNLIFPEDYSYLFSEHEDNHIRAWDIITGQMLWMKQGSYATISSSGQLLMLASYNKSVVQIFDVERCQIRCSLSFDPAKVTSIAVSPDDHPNGQYVAVSTSDNKLHLWDMKHGNLQKIFGIADRITEGIQSPEVLAFSPDAKLVVIIDNSSDSKAVLWDTTTNTTRWQVSHYDCKGFDMMVSSASFSSDGKLVALSGDSERMYVFDLDTGNCRGGHYTSGPYIRFVDNSTIITNQGMVTVDSAQKPSYFIKYEDSKYSGPGLNDTYTWVTLNGSRILWLPSEYRPKPIEDGFAPSKGIMVGEDKIAIGRLCGQVLIITIDDGFEQALGTANR